MMTRNLSVAAAGALVLFWQASGAAQDASSDHDHEAVEPQGESHDGHAASAPAEASDHQHGEAPASLQAPQDETADDAAQPGGMAGMRGHMAGQPMQDCAMMGGQRGDGCPMMEGHEDQAGAHASHDDATQSADHDAHAIMTGALGPYPMAREASGTAWSPDLTPHGGVHATAAGWDLMGHLLLNGVYDWQDGPRGDEKSFISGMIMGSARRPLGERNTLQLRAMLSPDPFMGESGYPLLLASGETADGVTPLVDRQHPHDLFMELSASVSRRLTDSDSAFVYAGLPGEPAFGPPAFMHRASILDSPEAPISHHWLDSTHITFGVVTAGWVHEDWKIEASRFHGREPDEHRFDIETGELDSTAVRLSWNPAPAWSLQASWADVTSPEQLEPDEDQENCRRARSTRAISATAPGGRRRSPGAAAQGTTMTSTRSSWKAL